MSKKTNDLPQTPDEAILSINEYQLDKEWLNQPVIFFEYARGLADARRELEEAKADLELCKAELDQEIRSAPDEFGLSKITEAVVSSTIVQQPEYQVKSRAVVKAKHAVDVLQAAVTALDHRKRALEKLVDLHGQSYFATPTTKDEHAKESFEETRKRRVRKGGKA